jgi:type IV secretory pathway protease TraF
VLRLFWRLVEACRTLASCLSNLPRDAAGALGGLEEGRHLRRKRIARALLIVMPIAFLAALFVPKVTLVMTPSIDAWAVRAAPGPIGKGDLVMFTLRHPIAGPKPVNVTKYVLCVPGERLSMVETPSRFAAHERDAHYFCNDALLGVSLPYSARGLKLAHFHWSGIIPQGQVYVGSHHPRGFDSRYFGMVAIERLTRMERLL